MWTDENYYASLPACLSTHKAGVKQATKIHVLTYEMKLSFSDILLLRLHNHIYNAYKSRNLNMLVGYSIIHRKYENIAITLILLLIIGSLTTRVLALMLSVWTILSFIMQRINLTISQQLNIASIGVSKLCTVYDKYQSMIANCDRMISICQR